MARSLRSSPIQPSVAEIEALGGKAIADGADIADEQESKELAERAIARFGRLDVMVNNAGILRDRTLANMSFDEWDAAPRRETSRSRACRSRRAIVC